MAKKIYKLVDKNEHCALLRRLDGGGFKIVDIEGDTIFMGKDIKVAQSVFDTYDLNKVREERYKAHEEWMKQFVEE